METQKFYEDGLWDAIINHPDFNIGTRELEALSRFLPDVAHCSQSPTQVIHLGIGNGREIPLITNHLDVTEYLVNDICEDVLKRVVAKAIANSTNVTFSAKVADIEERGELSHLRRSLHANQAIIVLAGNAVIFSNRELDGYLHQAMKSEDFLLITVEEPHSEMEKSYTLEPVYRLLSQSGIALHQGNTDIWYDTNDHCLKMGHLGEVLLASYKPTKEQFVERMNSAGFEPVTISLYGDIHMIAGLFRLATTD